MSSSRRKKRIQEESSSEEDALFNSDDDDSSDEKAHEEGSLTFSASRMKDAMVSFSVLLGLHIFCHAFFTRLNFRSLLL